MLSSIVRKSLIIVVFFLLAGLPALAAGNQCELSFAPQKTDQGVSEFPPGSAVAIDGLQLRVARGFGQVEAKSDIHDLLPQGFYSPELTYQAQPGSLAYNFTRLAQNRSLMDQMDPKLGQRGLLVPNGGLCASTCGANVLHAIASYSYKNLENELYSNSDWVIQKLVDSVKLRFNHDARKGMHLDQLSEAMQDVSQSLGMQIRTQATKLNYVKPFSEASLEFDQNTIAVIAVLTEKSAHALVLTGYDRQTRIAYFNDPDQSWLAYQATVSPTYYQGIPTVKLEGVSYGFGAHVGTVTQILYVKSPEPALPAPRPYTNPQPYHDQYSRPAPAPEPHDDRYLRPSPNRYNDRYLNPAPNPVTDYSRFMGKRILIRTKTGEEVKMTLQFIRKTSDIEFLPPGLYGIEKGPMGESNVEVSFDRIASVTEIQNTVDRNSYHSRSIDRSLVNRAVNLQCGSEYPSGYFEVIDFKEPGATNMYPVGAIKIMDTKNGQTRWIPLNAIMSVDIVH